MVRPSERTSYAVDRGTGVGISQSQGACDTNTAASATDAGLIDVPESIFGRVVVDGWHQLRVEAFGGPEETGGRADRLVGT